ncbi:hypothetical protein ScPMuIL_010478 [Solemya velum]
MLLLLPYIYICAVSCGVPPDESNMNKDATTSVSYPNTVTYVCADGYENNGESGVRTCQSTGTWGPLALACTAVSCGAPPIETGMTSDVTGPVSYPGTVTYSCITGYIHNGMAQTRSCLADKTWSTLASTCTAVSCGVPPAEAGMTSDVTNAVSFPNSVTYTCDIGYNSNGGSGERACQDDGTWSVLVLLCTGVDCNVPPGETGMDSDMTSAVAYPQTVTYSCKNGYISNGLSGVRQCQHDGTWSSVLIVCTAVSCGQPTTETGMTSDTTALVSFPGEVTYSCEDGYDSNAGSGVRKCQADGSWSILLLICTAVSCGEPATDASVTTNATGQVSFPQTVTHSCANGYTSSGGSDVSQCRSDGSWTAVTLVCTAVSCGVPPPESNMTSDVTDSVSFPDGVTYSCLDGYVGNGRSGTRTCQENGAWSYLALVCTVGSPKTSGSTAEEGSNTGTIVGVLIPMLLLIIAGCIVAYYFYRKRSKKQSSSVAASEVELTNDPNDELVDANEDELTISTLTYLEPPKSPPLSTILPAIEGITSPRENGTTGSIHPNVLPPISNHR